MMKLNKTFKCGCVNHSTNNYDNFGFSIQTKSKCDDFRLMKEVIVHHINLFQLMIMNMNLKLYFLHILQKF